MERLKVKELIVVEGKCDISAVKAAVDADVISTGGFGIYNNRELAQILRAAAGDRGVILFTDSDRSGFKIRSKLKSILGNENVKQAYSPVIYGKEARKARPSADGILGVEGMSRESIIASLRDAGAEFGGLASESGNTYGGITKADMFALRLTGTDDSFERRGKLLSLLGLPTHLTPNALLIVLNARFNLNSLKEYMENGKL